MKSTIVVIITRAEIGGAQNYVFSFIEQLKEDFNFVVYCGSKGFLTTKLADINVKVKIIPSIDSKNALSAISKIRYEFKKDKPQLINTHSSLASIYGRLASTGLKIATVYSVHGWAFANNAKASRRFLGPLIERACGKLTAHWITETHFDKEVGIQRKIIPADNNVTVIYNGIEDTASSKQWDEKQTSDIKQIAFVGRVSEQKKPLVAIAVMSHLPNEFQLTVFCDNAKDENLINMIASLRLEKRVKLVDNELDTANALYQYDMLLVTSKYEGMPLCMLEAMSAALPMVTSNVCGLKELVTNGENGYLVNDINSAESYSKSILKVFSSYEHTKSLGLKSRQRYLENHTLIKMTNQLKHVFSQFN